MRLKVLLLALVFAISFVGIFTPAAKAEGPTVTPYADVMVWFGEAYKDKYASGAYNDKGEKRSDMNQSMGVNPQGDLGVRGAVGNVSVNVAFMTRTPAFSAGTESQQVYLFLEAMFINLGSVNLTIGKWFTPYAYLTFNDVANSFAAIGWNNMAAFAFFDPGRDMIKASFGSVYVGLFNNSKNDTANYAVMLPMIAAGYEFGNFATPMYFGVHGLFQTYKNTNPGALTGTYALNTNTGAIDFTPTGYAANPLYNKSVTSYGATAKFSMNMAPMAFAVQACGGVNTGDMGVLSGDATNDGSKYLNTVSYAGWADFQYTAGIAKFGAAVGYKSVKYDKKGTTGQLGTKADQKMAVSAVVKISPMPNFAFTPSVLFTDEMKDEYGEKEGKSFVIGVLFEAHI